MKFVKNLDLYMVIIIVSGLLLPVVGGWAYWLQGQLEIAHTALHEATKPNGDLAEIGKFEKAVEDQKRSSLTQQSGPDNYNVYFDRCFRDAELKAPGQTGGLKETDFSITPSQPEFAGANAEDKIVSIAWRRDGKALPLTRSFLLAALFNCEAQSPIWKLRDLSIQNANTSLKTGGAKAPPQQLTDTWTVTRMSFGSRQPRGKRK